MNLEREFELEPGEAVEKVVRVHWFLFALGLLPYAVLAIIPLLIPPAIKLAPQLAPQLAGLAALSHFGGWGAPLARVALGCWWLLLWSSAFNLFTRYFLNAWILTNQRIVEIEQKGFFNREVSSLLLSRIQDVTIETTGLLHSLLDIGDINVQTAGSVDRFTMDNVPNPPALRDLILQYAAAHSAASPAATGL